MLLGASIAVAVVHRQAPPGAAPGVTDPSAARQFVLVDGEGRARASLQLTASGQPRLLLEGNDGSTVACGFQDATKDFPDVTMTDTAGRRRFAVSVSDSGPELSLFDDGGQIAAKLVCGGRDQGPALYLARRPTEGFAQIGLFSNASPFLDLVDGQGKEVMGLPAPK